MSVLWIEAFRRCPSDAAFVRRQRVARHWMKMRVDEMHWKIVMQQHWWQNSKQKRDEIVIFVQTFCRFAVDSC